MAAWNPDRSERRTAQPLDFFGADQAAGNPQHQGAFQARTGPQLVSDNSGHEQQLSRVVELEIIPRLLLMHSHSTAGVRGHAMAITAAHIATLAELAVDDDANSASRFVRALAEAGATPRQLFLDLLGPSAALMGSWWCDDVFGFADVSIGLCRLQQALHEQAGRSRPPLQVGAPRILLAAPPESQHTFGAAIAAECFAHAGWDAHYAPGLSWEALRCQLAYESFDVLALSLSCDAQVVSAASAIVGLRRVSSNQRMGVLVGGPLAFACPELASRCGADGIATDAGAAIDLAQRWLGESDPRM